MTRWFTQRPVTARLFALTAAFLTIAALFHGRLLAVKRIPASAEDLLGLGSDLLMALGLAALLLALPRFRRTAGVVAAIGWSLACYANFEFARVLEGALVLKAGFLAYLLDPTFLFGSALNISEPILFVFGLLLTPLAAVWLLKAPVEGRGRLVLVAVLCAGIAIALARPTLDAADWRRSNFLALNVNRLFAPDTRPETALAPDEVKALSQLLKPDLSGQPRIELGRRGTNVLLIMAESISAAFLPSLAERHGIAYDPIRMQKTDAALKHALAYASIVNHQRETNRGEYTILCGDYPKLDERIAKMTDYTLDPSRDCLPRILKRAGYEAVYMQAAPLWFMHKDKFMPAAGFDRVLGEESFTDGYARNEWGVDDRAFFERADSLIDELQQQDKPWFLTLLSAGTHHPYILPPQAKASAADGDPSGESGDRERAFAYLDQALGDFFERLRAKGVFDDTLVVLTGDESVGMSFGYDNLTQTLSRNWGLVAAFVPNERPRVVTESFFLSDLALSLVDYLGLADRTPQVVGRSLFRTYPDAPRPAFFGSNYEKRSYLYDPSGALTVCDLDFSQCEGYRIEESLFAGKHEKTELDSRQVARMQAMRSLTGGGRASVGGRYQHETTLYPPQTLTVPDDDGIHKLLVSDGLEIPARSGLEVTLNLRLLGDGGRARLFFTILDGKRALLVLNGVDIASGQSERIGGVLMNSQEGLSGVKAFLGVQRVAGTGLRLQLERSRLRLTETDLPQQKKPQP